MKKINKVLIALDYNPNAQNIAESGFELAKSLNAQVILLHVISDPAYYASTVYDPIMGFGGFANLNSLESGVLDDIKKNAEDFLSKSKTYLGDESIETIAIEGDIADGIIETAKEQKADIIVLGSHSRKWLEQILLGSTAEEVLHQSTIPLFIVPTKNHT